MADEPQRCASCEAPLVTKTRRTPPLCRVCAAKRSLAVHWQARQEQYQRYHRPRRPAAGARAA